MAVYKTFSSLLLLLMLVCIGIVASVESLPKNEAAQGGFGRSKRQADDAQGDLLHQFRTDVGPGKVVDLVVVLDRSKAMGKQFYYTILKPLARALITQFAVIHPAYVRIAILSFAVDVKVELDCISNPSPDCTKCHIMEGPAPSFWDQMYFNADPVLQGGTNLQLAFETLQTIIQTGAANRPDATPIILLLTDGEYKTYDPYPVVNQLKSQNTKIYVVGLGPWFQFGNVREIATNASYYGIYEDWDAVVQTYKRSTTIDTPPLWVPIDGEFCNQTCISSECYCDANTGQSKCRCNPGYALDATTGLCDECVYHTYKPEVGNGVCTTCPYGYGTNNQGSTSVADCSACLITPGPCDSFDACASSPCNDNQYCVEGEGDTYNCLCKGGFHGVDCSVNMNECASVQCTNGGTCIDMINDYTCVAQYGYRGRDSEIEIDECFPDLCENNGTCEDRVNAFKCHCEPGYMGVFCQDLDDSYWTTTPTTTTKSNTTDPVLPVGGDEKDDKTLIIIIACACAGGILLIIIIAVIITVIMYRRRKRAEQEAQEAKKELATTLERMRKNNGSTKKFRKTLTKTIRDHFSGFWKRKTLRGGYWEDDDNVKEGAPSAPPKRRPDLLGENIDLANMANMDVVYMTNERIKDSAGMSGWSTYLNDLRQSAVINSGCIGDVDSEKHACSENFNYNTTEIHNASDLLNDLQSNTTMVVQGGEFHIWENDGTVAVGNTIGHAIKPEVLILSKTRKYVVIIVADDVGEVDKLKKEVQWITDHIKKKKVPTATLR